MSEHGLPCWYELATADPAAVQPFYAALLGWQFADSGMAGMTYIIASAQDSMVAGLFKAEPEQPTGWTFYITVDNADATAAQAAALGAQVIVPPSDIPDTGRFAVMLDPQGASFARAADGAGDDLQHHCLQGPRHRRHLQRCQCHRPRLVRVFRGRLDQSGGCDGQIRRRWRGT